jgi:outer membrane cobalamin receptor
VLNLGYRARDLASFDVSIARVGSREDLDFTTFPAKRVTLSCYTRVDLAAAVALVPGRPGRPVLTLTSRVENALDARYEPVKGFPAPGRTVLVGARFYAGH